MTNDFCISFQQLISAMYSTTQFNQSPDDYLGFAADCSYNEAYSVISSSDSSRQASSAGSENRIFSTLGTSSSVAFANPQPQFLAKGGNGIKKPLACSTALSFEAFIDKSRSQELTHTRDLTAKSLTLSKPGSGWSLTRFFSIWNQPTTGGKYRETIKREMELLFQTPDLGHMTGIYDLYNDRFGTVKEMYFTEMICRAFIMAGEKNMSLYFFLKAHMGIFPQLENNWGQIKNDLWNVDPKFMNPEIIDCNQDIEQSVESKDLFTSYVNHLRVERKSILEELLLLSGPDGIKEEGMWRNVLRFSEMVFTRTEPPKTWLQRLKEKLKGKVEGEEREDSRSEDKESSATPYRSLDRLDYP